MIIRILLILIMALIYTTCSLMTSSIERNRVPTTWTTSNKMIEKCRADDFRYFIISDELRSENLRHIEIFLDDEQFILENLKKLFIEISEKFPQPKYLTVVVKTDWSQIEFPRGCSGNGKSGLNESTNFNFNFAVFNRHETKKVIRYTRMLNTDELETVELE